MHAAEMRDLLKPKKPPSQVIRCRRQRPRNRDVGAEPCIVGRVIPAGTAPASAGTAGGGDRVVRQCIEREPERAEAYYKRANALNGLGRLEPALEDYDRAISLNPSYAYALCNRGAVLERLGRREEALSSYDRAIELDPKDALTHYNRGSVLKDLERYEEALASYESAIGLNGNYAEAHVNRGNVLQELWRPEAAIESFERAIALNPAIAQAFQGRGVCLHRLKRLEQALADYNKAIALKPDLAAAYVGRGVLLADLDRHAEAVTDYLKATELEPDPEAYQSLAASLVRLKRFDLAIASLDKAIALDPTRELPARHQPRDQDGACSWDGLGEDLERIAKGMSEQRPVCNPMTLASLIDSAALLRSAAEIFVRDQIDRILRGGSQANGRNISCPGFPAGIGQDPDRVFFGRFPDASRGVPDGRLIRASRSHEVRGDGLCVRPGGE